jgi:hypothetical protein
MPSPMNPTIKAASLRIQKALSRPGATGMKGFLLWTEAAWPPAIATKVLQAASKYTPGAGVSPATSVPAMVVQPGGGFAHWGTFGDVSTDSSGITVDLTTIPDSVSSAISDANTAPVSPTTAATPSAPASQSWLSDITGAVSAATTAYLGVSQVQAAQSIFQTNLARAQQGLPMIPTNPTQYGLPAPTANIGLASSAQNTLLILGGLVLAGVVVASIAKGK